MGWGLGNVIGLVMMLTLIWFATVGLSTTNKRVGVVAVAFFVLAFGTMPGGVLNCRPVATGNPFVDWLCEPLFDKTYPTESAEAQRRFWAREPPIDCSAASPQLCR